VLYWLTHGNPGTYFDALALAVETGITPSTGAVRTYRSKYGIALNLEQQLEPDLGCSCGLEGGVEQNDFTDIDETVSSACRSPARDGAGRSTRRDWTAWPTRFRAVPSCTWRQAARAGLSATGNCLRPAHVEF
jgi:hypothetical protein